METKTVITPEEAAFQKEAERVRLEAGRNLAVKAKEPEVKKEFGEPITFRLRRWKNTNFQGLWELALLDSKGNCRQIVTDANTLQEALELAGNVMEDKGY